MEIRYYICRDKEDVKVDRKTYDEWNGDKYIKSGFVTEYSDGTVFDISKMFLPLRYY